MWKKRTALMRSFVNGRRREDAEDAGGRMVGAKKEDMVIRVDDREPAVILDILGIEGIKVKRERLKVGDYVWEDVCVERKEIDDFCASIMDGRLKRQVKAMKENFKHCYVLVSGRIGDRNSDIHEHSLLGMMASLIVHYGMKVVCVDDDLQLIYLMKRIFERHREAKYGN